MPVTVHVLQLLSLQQMLLDFAHLLSSIFNIVCIPLLSRTLDSFPLRPGHRLSSETY